MISFNSVNTPKYYAQGAFEGEDRHNKEVSIDGVLGWMHTRYVTTKIYCNIDWSALT